VRGYFKSLYWFNLEEEGDWKKKVGKLIRGLKVRKLRKVIVKKEKE